MSTAERFTITISLLGLVVAVMGGLLGYVIKSTRTLTQTEERIADLAGDMRTLVERKDQDHAAIRADIQERDQRGAAVHRELSDRLTWIERRELDERRRRDP